MDMTRPYPIDVWGIKRIGVEAYVNDHRLPRFHKEAYADFINLTGRYLEWINRMADISNHEAIDLLIALAPAQHLIFSAIHAARQEKTLRNLGVKLLLSREERSVKDFARDILNWNLVAFLKHFDRGQRVLTSAHWMIVNCLSEFKARWMGEKIYNLFGINQKELVTYVSRNCITHLPIYPCYRGEKLDSLPWVEEMVRDCLNSLTIFQEEDFPLDRECVARAWEKIFIRGAEFYRQNLAALGDRRRSHLLVTKPGNLDFRLFAQAWRRAGGNTIGFTHGNTVFHTYNPLHRVLLEHLVTDQYICSNQLEIENHRKAIEDFFPSLRIPSARFASLDEPIPEPNTINRNRPPNNPPVAMILGYPHRMWGESTWLLHSPEIVRIEYQLIVELKKAGYKVIYKIHPDRYVETFDLFQGIADEGWGQPFIEVRTTADLLIYSDRFTTSFVEGYVTDIPILLFLDENDPLDSSTRKTLIKRVFFLFGGKGCKIGNPDTWECFDTTIIQNLKYK